MKYRDIIGYSKKQSKEKVVKEQPKPKKNQILENVKKEINEWHHQPPTEKRWSGAFEAKDGLTEHERQLKEVGAAPVYKKHIKLIDKQREQVGREVLKFYELLRKKGLDDAADELLNNYKNCIVGFGKQLKQLVRKIM